MPKYRITGIVGASVDCGTVEAENAKAAIAKAWETLEIGSPMLCHQCSHDLEVADVNSLIAYNVDDDNDHAEE